MFPIVNAYTLTGGGVWLRHGSDRQQVRNLHPSLILHAIRRLGSL